MTVGFSQAPSSAAVVNSTPFDLSCLRGNNTSPRVVISVRGCRDGDSRLSCALRHFEACASRCRIGDSAASGAAALSHAPLASGLPEKPDLSEENAKSCKNSQQPVPPLREMSHPSSSAYVFAAESSSLLMRRARNRSPCIARSLLLAPLPRVDAFLERSRVLAVTADLLSSGCRYGCCRMLLTGRSRLRCLRAVCYKQRWNVQKIRPAARNARAELFVCVCARVLAEVFRGTHCSARTASHHCLASSDPAMRICPKYWTIGNEVIL